MQKSLRNAGRKFAVKFATCTISLVGATEGILIHRLRVSMILFNRMTSKACNLHLQRFQQMTFWLCVRTEWHYVCKTYFVIRLRNIRQLGGTNWFETKPLTWVEQHLIHANISGKTPTRGDNLAIFSNRGQFLGAGPPGDRLSVQQMVLKCTFSNFIF